MSENEKILREFKVIETEDGFRIEMKGDKEALRHMLPFMTPFGMHQPRPGFGGGRPFGGHRPFGGRHRGHHRPPFGFHMQHKAEALHNFMAEHGDDLDAGWDESDLPPRAQRKIAALRGWMAERGYDLGPWWDEPAAPSEGDAAPNA